MAKQGCEGDDVLSLEGSEEFSGFEEDDIPAVAANVVVRSQAPVAGTSRTSKDECAKRGTLQSSANTSVKSVVSKPSKAKKSGKKKSKSKSLDIDSLSSEDLQQLKKRLGIVNQPETHRPNEEDEYYRRDFYSHDRPNIHVEMDTNDISDTENVPSQANMSRNLQQELFGEESSGDEDNEEWMLPKLKVVEKGKPIAKSLASLINTACTNQCANDELIKKYKIPQNCDKLCPPVVNSEVYKTLDKRARTNDRFMMEIQNLVAASVVPIIKLAETLKPQISCNNDAKALLSDSITLMGQVQMNLSLRRRYAIRPSLKKKYSNLCNVNVPITSNLFGDDVAKEIKNCDNMQSLGKERYGSYEHRPYRGKQPFRGAKRGRAFHPYYNPNQFYHSNQGYQPRGGYNTGNQMSSRGYARGRGRPATATVTSAPNDN